MMKIPTPTPIKPSYWQEILDAMVTIIKGLSVTGKNLWRVTFRLKNVFNGHGAVTITERWGARKIAMRYRGTIGLTIDRRTGKENCIGCLACERICPDHCIHIEVIDDKEGHKGKYPTVFIIDNNLCSLCGLCVEVCPVPALIHTEVWQVGGYSHKDLVYDKDRLLKVGEWQQEKWLRMGLDSVDKVTGKNSMQMTDEEWKAEEEKKKKAAAERAAKAITSREQDQAKKTQTSSPIHEAPSTSAHTQEKPNHTTKSP